MTNTIASSEDLQQAKTHRVPPYNIADAHAHIFPAKVSEKATIAISEFYSLPYNHIGTAQELVQSEHAIRMTKCIVCSSATTPHQVQRINDFIKGQCDEHTEFVGLGTLHPYMEDAESEIVRIIELGLHGIKLHPDFQKFDIDDERAIPMYRLVSKYKLPILFHSGDAVSPCSRVEKLSKVAKMFPELRCIAAHFGGYLNWSSVPKDLKLDNMYFDTSSTLFSLDYDTARDMIRDIGVEKFMFGTDFPLWDPAEEMDRYYSMYLSEEENSKILYENFEKFYNVQVN